MRWILALICLTPFAAQAETIYLCVTNSGGMFWSSAHCHQHNALIDRMVTVPDALPWEQKVALGEQARSNAAALAAPPVHPVVAQQPQLKLHSDKPAECQALNARITHLDATARQPQSGPTQDWIAAEKKAARDRQFRLKC